MVFTAQQALEIERNTAKVSADGSINTHSDVDVVSPSVGDIMSYDGVNWTNTPLVTGADAQQSADIAANSAKVSADGPVSSHSDVNIVSPSIGETLTWNGANWVNSAPVVGVTSQQAADIELSNATVSASGSISVHADVEIVNLQTDQVLQWNGEKWVNVDSPTAVAPATYTESNYFPSPLPSGLMTKFSYTPAVPSVINIGGGPSSSGSAGYGTTGFNQALRNTALQNPNGSIPGKTPCNAVPFSRDLENHLFVRATVNNEYMENHYIAMHGLEQVYNAVNPFPSENVVTITQLMNWNVQVINHFRRICGNPIPIIMDERLNFEALWSVEKANTSYYPPQPTTVAEYNATFIPSLAEQASIYGIASPTMTTSNNFNFHIHAKRGLNKLGINQGNVMIASDCPFYMHMVEILRGWSTDFLFYGDMNPDHPLLVAFLTRTHVGMCIHAEPPNTEYFYRFTFSGPILNRCFQ